MIRIWIWGLAACVALPASAADCPFTQAIYTQPQTAYELHFTRAQEDVFGLTPANSFIMQIPGSSLRLEGRVGNTTSTTGPNPHAQLLLECGPRDLPDACRVWSGLIYELRDGMIQAISPETFAAPDQLVLTDVQLMLQMSSLRFDHDLEVFPADTFVFSRCAP